MKLSNSELELTTTKIEQEKEPENKLKSATSDLKVAVLVVHERQSLLILVHITKIQQCVSSIASLGL